MDTGDKAPDFTLPDETGRERRLTELLQDGPIVLFFYPAAMTAGCTAEACHFRDLTVELTQVGASPVGISTDEVGAQAEFADKHSLGYPLLADVDGVVAEQFGVRRKRGPIPVKRWSFVIDTDRTVLGVIKSEIRMGVHAERALEILRDHRQAA
jgi:thioredoxin-dependent peroxiredoxin